jgi:hypothetical protein
MAAVGLLHGIDCQEADGVDTELIQGRLSRRGQIRLLHGDFSIRLNIKTFIEIVPFKAGKTIDDGFKEELISIRMDTTEFCPQLNEFLTCVSFVNIVCKKRSFTDQNQMQIIMG